MVEKIEFETQSDGEPRRDQPISSPPAAETR